VVDLRPPSSDLDDVRAVLDGVDRQLRAMWSSALERGEFREIDRLLEASQALQRVAVALAADTPMCGVAADPGLAPLPPTT